MKRQQTTWLGDDSGFTLVTVLGVVLILTVVATGAFIASQQALHNSVQQTKNVIAFEAANSGVDAALQRINVHSYIAGDFPLTGTLPDGSSYEASVTPLGNSNFSCGSLGRDPSGAVAKVQVNFFSINYWNMEIGGGQNSLGGGSLHGTSSVYGPLYVRGAVTLPSDSDIEVGPIFINVGSDPTLGLALTGSGKLGADAPIDVYCNGVTPTLGSKNFGASSVSNAVPNIVLPPVDAQYLGTAYSEAKAESIDNLRGAPPTSAINVECSGGDANTYTTVQPPNSGTWTRQKAPGASSFYKLVGVDSGWSPTIGAGIHPLTIGDSSFGSWYGDGHTSTLGQHDDFAYDATNRVLYVEGTVFIDGPLTITPAVTYVGNGKIVVNGDVTIAGGLIPATSNGFMDAGHVLGIVTPGNFIDSVQSSNNKSPTDVPDVCGAFFVGSDFRMTGNCLVRGSVLANSITFNHSNEHLVTEPGLPSFLPPGMPGGDGFILSKSRWTRQ